MWRITTPLRCASLVGVLSWLSSSHCPALTVLFEDDFESGIISDWTYGKDDVPDTVEPGDVFAAEQSDSNYVLKSRDDVGSSDPSEFVKQFHNNMPSDFFGTGDTILQLDVDIEVIETVGANYRIGLYSVLSGSHTWAKGGVILRIDPAASSNNVTLYTYNPDGTFAGSSIYTTDNAHLQGVNHFSMQLDFSASDTSPRIRVYSDNELLFEETISGGFNRDSATGSTVYIMGQHHAYQTNGAEYHLDNVRLTSFRPATLTVGGL